MMDEKDNIGNEEEEDTTIILTDENGQEVEFDFLDNVEYEGNSYLILLPLDDKEEENEVVIMRLDEGETEEDDSLVSETDPDVLDAVYEIFKENNKDFFDFEEDI